MHYDFLFQRYGLDSFQEQRLAHHTTTIPPSRLALMARPEINRALTGILRGLEKESLRITPEGTLAQTDHPAELGSALKHPHITTDYSEALVEFITEPFTNIDALLQQLDDIHRFTFDQLERSNERLWPSSMPCKLGSDAEIPVARYGSSNAGLMKTIYRVGLGHRYGRAMQTIAGVHYNFSLPDDFWQALHADENSSESLTDFKTRKYFALIRNFRRYFWLMIYLFGAAPAVCGSFVQGRQHRLQPFSPNHGTMYLPEATSLRMGDLGYQSSAQQALVVNYNDLPSYLNTLCGAITRTHPAYETLGLRDAQGNYQQLNTGLLQIENEFYSSIRPKRTARSGETALQALRLGGVEYIEVRCLDLNPYEPLGVNAEQLRVMDAFLMFCLLQDSPETNCTVWAEEQQNQKDIVYAGRDPQLQLLNQGQSVPMRSWAKDILEQTLICARLLDEANGSTQYEEAVRQQFAKLEDPSLTPSARVLADMQTEDISFFTHSLQLAEQHRRWFASRKPDATIASHFEQLRQQSLDEQHAQEKQPQLPFDEYLADYYQQYHQCGCQQAVASAG